MGPDGEQFEPQLAGGRLFPRKDPGLVARLPIGKRPGRRILRDADAWQISISLMQFRIHHHSYESAGIFIALEGIEQIVLGPSPDKGIARLVLGSLTRQVRALMESAGKPCEVL